MILSFYSFFVSSQSKWVFLFVYDLGILATLRRVRDGRAGVARLARGAACGGRAHFVVTNL